MGKNKSDSSKADEQPDGKGWNGQDDVEAKVQADRDLAAAADKQGQAEYRTDVPVNDPEERAKQATAPSSSLSGEGKRIAKIVVTVTQTDDGPNASVGVTAGDVGNTIDVPAGGRREDFETRVGQVVGRALKMSLDGVL